MTQNQLDLLLELTRVTIDNNNQLHPEVSKMLHEMAEAVAVSDDEKIIVFPRM